MVSSLFKVTDGNTPFLQHFTLIMFNKNILISLIPKIFPQILNNIKSKFDCLKQFDLLVYKVVPKDANMIDTHRKFIFVS